METNSIKVLWAQLKTTRLEHDQYNFRWAFGVSYRNGYPRISIYKMTDNTSTVAITLPMKSTELTYLALSIDAVADGDKQEMRLDMRNNVYVDGVRSEKVVTNGSVRIFKEHGKVILETRFFQADSDKRVSGLGVPIDDNGVVFRFPVINGIYFDNVDPILYAKAYSSNLVGLNTAYCATLADRESTER